MNSINGKGASMIIRSDRLEAEIDAPGTIYHRTRFDWTGFVTQVTLDGRHTFCVPEDYDPAMGTGGIGLCNEFGIDQAIGYEDAKPGQEFPKLGVGLLIRPDEQPYNFFRPYTIAQPFPIHVETAAGQARFIIDPLDCRGYAARLIKTVSVEGNSLAISYVLENVGRQAIVTNEYCHNFIGINRQPVGPGYRLRLPYPVTLEETPDVLDVKDKQVSWKYTPDKPFYCRPQGFSQTSQPQWELAHAPGGVRMCEYDDFSPERVALWGTTHVISAEIFNAINLPPGQSQTWTRRYEFND